MKMNLPDVFKIAVQEYKVDNLKMIKNLVILYSITHDKFYLNVAKKYKFAHIERQKFYEKIYEQRNKDTEPVDSIL